MEKASTYGSVFKKIICFLKFLACSFFIIKLRLFYKSETKTKHNGTSLIGFSAKKTLTKTVVVVQSRIFGTGWARG